MSSSFAFAFAAHMDTVMTPLPSYEAHCASVVYTVCPCFAVASSAARPPDGTTSQPAAPAAGRSSSCASSGRSMARTSYTNGQWFGEKNSAPIRCNDGDTAWLA
uniref:Uncharacterized protein n=1 Tax=Oryza glumipatula TaxID=40148 RepID=A0A0E0BQ69_9ORYZ